MEKEIYLLKKQLENRESTINFLNGIIDAQSESIEKFKEKLKQVNELEELNEKYEDLMGCVRYYKELAINLLEKNEELQSKLNVLYEAFETVRKPNDDKPTENTICYKKELLSPQWKKKREEVFERYGKQCVECGSTDNIQVHHLVYRKGRHIWEYDVDELIPLCRKCHEKISNDKKHKFHQKYLS